TGSPSTEATEQPWWSGMTSLRRRWGEQRVQRHPASQCPTLPPRWLGVRVEPEVRQALKRRLHDPLELEARQRLPRTRPRTHQEPEVVAWGGPLEVDRVRARLRRRIAFARSIQRDHRLTLLNRNPA